MRIYIFSLAILFLSLEILGQWQQTDFVLGAFVGPEISNVNDAIAKTYFEKVADANIDLITYPYHLFNSEYPNGIIFSESFNDRSISIARQAGLNYMVNDSRHMPAAFWDEDSPESIFNETLATQLVDHYTNLSSGDREALFGYNLKDEPSPDHINPSQIVYLRNYVEFIKDNDNSKLAYINLLPYYENKSQT